MLALCDKTRDCYICVALMSFQGCGETVLALWNKTEDCYLCSRAAPALEKGIRSVCSPSDFPTNVGFREICRISSDIEPFGVNWSDFGCDD